MRTPLTQFFSSSQDIRYYLFYGSGEDLLFVSLLYLEKKLGLKGEWIDESLFLEQAASLFSATLFTKTAQRLIFIQNFSEKSLSVLKQSKVDHFIFVGWSLKLRSQSPCVKWFQDTPYAVALACYPLEQEMQTSLIRSFSKQEGLSLSFEACRLIATFIPLLSLPSFLGKFFLRQSAVVNVRQKTFTESDIYSFLGKKEKQKALWSALLRRQTDYFFRIEVNFDVTQGILSLRQAVRAFLQMRQLLVFTQQGLTLTEAAQNVKPPLFFKDIPLFRKSYQEWTLKEVDDILKRLACAEVCFKRNPHTLKWIQSLFVKRYI